VANTRIYSEHAVRSVKEWRRVGQTTVPLPELDIAYAVAACAFFLTNFQRKPYVSRTDKAVRRRGGGIRRSSRRRKSRGSAQAASGT
jgi:hypothetical protein